MKFLKKIKNDDQLYAIIIYSDYSSDGIEFFTPENFSQQLGYMKRLKGYKIKPHYHNKVVREVASTNEVLFVKSGKVRVDFYDNNQTYFKSCIINKGDIILLASGGHGFEMLETSEMVEVKQGPYAGDLDKSQFESNLVNKSIILE